MVTEAIEFIRKRTEALATVALTRSSAVTVMPFHHGELDLVCSVRPGHKDEAQGFLLFGATLFGTALRLDTVDDANAFVRDKSHVVAKRREETYYIPVVLLLFSMQTDKGYFAWLTKPESDKQTDELVLNNVKTIECKKLDHRAINDIVDGVKGWYTALSKTMVVR